MTRVLIAPQEFKGSLSAADAAAAIGDGVRAAQPAWTLDLLPMSDGGPGFLEAMRAASRGDMLGTTVHDALGRPVLGRYVILRSPRTAIVEAAQANGLSHIGEEERDALRADTAGVGELIAAAVESRPAGMVIGVGGSATTDGGHGMARALGARFLDEAGRELPPGGVALGELARIDWRRPPGFDGIDITVATDVTNPLTGTNGAAIVYGPQKGASPADAEALDAALVRYAAVLRRSLGADVGSIPGGGAAGGLAAGLVAFLGARIESGFEVVAQVSGLHERLAAADIVLTGEGSFDSQSLQGKTTGRLIELAAAAGKPCVVFAARASGPVKGAEIRTLSDVEPDARRSMVEAAGLLTEVARRWAAGA